MKLLELKQRIATLYPGAIEKLAYRETTYFYNPGQKLPNGVYFLTIKESDGPNDKSSFLDREDVFRVSFKPDPKSYSEHFGEKPQRPEKGKIVSLSHDFSQQNVWMPHPIYSWMGWTMVLSPTEETWEMIVPYVEESFERARSLFEKKIKKLTSQ